MSDKYLSSFTIETVGEVTGDKFPGVFKVKTRLSFKDALARDQIRRNLLGTLPDGASIRANSIADIFSELAVRINDAPSWWTNSDNGMELADDNVVRDVYEKALKAATDAAAEIQKRADEAKKSLAKTTEE